MKLSQYAKQQGISYKTAFRWWKAGELKGYQAASGTIIVTENEPARQAEKVAIYARVSSAEHKANLERQAERLSQYCEARGYQVAKVVKEIASGLNDSRPKLVTLLKDTSITRIVVEHKDRLTRFGFNYIETLFEIQGRTIEVVNVAENDKEDLLADLSSVIYSFCARLYGQRRAKRKTEKIVEELKSKEGDEIMQLVEQHVIKRGDPRWQKIDEAAFASKNLYNAANYIVRQAFIFDHIYLDNVKVFHLIKHTPAYKALPAKVSNDILRQLHKNWKSYFAAIKAYDEDPSKFLGHPKLPKYKDKQKGRNILVYDIQALCKKELRKGIIKPSQLGIEIRQNKQTLIRHA